MNFHLDVRNFKYQEIAHRDTASHSPMYGTELRLVMETGQKMASGYANQCRGAKIHTDF